MALPPVLIAIILVLNQKTEKTNVPIVKGAVRTNPILSPVPMLMVYVLGAKEQARNCPQNWIKRRPNKTTELLFGLKFIIGLIVLGNVLFRLAGQCQYITEDRIIC